jgi:hypothetical protein
VVAASTDPDLAARASSEGLIGTVVQVDGLAFRT